MLIATTNHISTDIAVMPLLWIVPLALYLITFIIAFDRPAWYRRVPVALIAIVSIYATAVTHHFGMGDAMFYELGTIGLVVFLLRQPIRVAADVPHHDGPFPHRKLRRIICNLPVVPRRDRPNATRAAIPHVVLPDDLSRRSTRRHLRHD